MAVLGGAVFAAVALWTRKAGRGMSAAVRVADLAGGYRPGQEALAEVSFAAGPGQVVGVLGPNGGGKTTLFRALLGELPVRRGAVELAGAPAYVPQTERARLDFPVSALDVALMGAYGRTPWYRRVARRDREAARAALARVGLEEVADETFGALSGGQRQRVLLARALVQDSPVLLLDEPLSGVDGASAARIEAVFAALRDEGRTLLVATHDVHQARALGRRPVPARKPGRVRPAGVDADARRPARDLRGGADRARGGGRGGRRGASRALMLDWLLDPFAGGIMQRALLEVLVLRWRAARSGCGSCSTATPTPPSR